MRVYKKRRIKCTILAVFAAVIFSVVLLWVYVLNPKILSIVEAETKYKTARLLNQAASDAIAQNPNFCELIVIEQSSDRILSVGVDSINAVLLRAAIVESVLDKCAKLEQEGVKIPVGTLSGISILSGKGVEISVDTRPLADVSAQFYSEAFSRGINQTHIKVYIRLRIEVVVVLGGKNVSVFSGVDFPIVESVVLGEVPDTSIVFPSFNGLNLVP